MRPGSSQARTQWTRDHSKYEALAFSVMQKAVRETARALPYEQMTRGTYKKIIKKNLSNQYLEDALYKIHYRIGTLHAERTLDMIDQAQKQHPWFSAYWQQFLIKWLRKYAGKKIVIMNRTLANFLIETMAKILERNEEEGNFATMITEIFQEFKKKGFYKWQIKRIVRTETTSAMNNSTASSADSSGIVLEKVWYSADDPRTRTAYTNPKTGEVTQPWDHREMDGVVVGQNEPFRVTNHKTNEAELLEYPGDPTGSAGNIINCRCRLSMRPKKDANGNLIITNRLPGSTGPIAVGPMPKPPKPSRAVSPKPKPKPRAPKHPPVLALDKRNGIIPGRKMNAWEDAYRGLKGHEMGAIYDENGVQIWGTRGTATKVNLDSRAKVLMRGNIFTHNHPNGFHGDFGGSFSTNDIKTTIQNRVKQMRAVDKKYTYIMDFDQKRFFEDHGRNPTSFDVLLMDKRFDKQTDEVKYHFWDKTDRTAKDLENLNESWVHEVWKRMVKFENVGGYKDGYEWSRYLKYRRIKNPKFKG